MGLSHYNGSRLRWQQLYSANDFLVARGDASAICIMSTYLTVASKVSLFFLLVNTRESPKGMVIT